MQTRFVKSTEQLIRIRLTALYTERLKTCKSPNMHRTWLRVNWLLFHRISYSLLLCQSPQSLSNKIYLSQYNIKEREEFLQHLSIFLFSSPVAFWLNQFSSTHYAIHPYIKRGLNFYLEKVIIGAIIWQKYKSIQNLNKW